jgi:hypothetical protein
MFLFKVMFVSVIKVSFFVDEIKFGVFTTIDLELGQIDHINRMITLSIITF